MVIQIPYESEYCFWITSFTQQTVGIPFFKINKWQIGIIPLILSLKSNNKHLVRSWHMNNYSIHTFGHITRAYNSHLSLVWIFFDRYKNEIFLHINVTDTLIIIHLPASNRPKTIDVYKHFFGLPSHSFTRNSFVTQPSSFAPRDTSLTVQHGLFLRNTERLIDRLYWTEMYFRTNLEFWAGSFEGKQIDIYLQFERQNPALTTM